MVYLLSDKKDFPKNWKGEIGRVNEALITKYAPDFQSRHFYISGPSSMVTSYKKLILTLGVKRNSITTDFFPGF